MKRTFFAFTVALCLLTILSCNDSENPISDFTGNKVETQLIPGTVEGNTTTGSLTIRERNDGKAQIEITLQNILKGASHPVHLHFGNLEDNGNVATFLSTLTEENGIGKSTTLLESLDNNTSIDYADLVNFDGSIKIHFESSGPLENEILGAANIGLNASQNEAYLSGWKSITICNSEFGNNLLSNQ